MRNTPLAAAVLFITLWLAGCNSKNKVNLLDTTAVNEVPSLGNFSFTFDKNLMPDSLLNYWDSTAYVEFTPPIRGRFRWENTNELIFSPEFELSPATEYSATITKNILRYNPKLSLGDCATQNFHTALLRLDQTSVYWNVNDGNLTNAFPQVDLYFNYKVSPEKLRSLLQLTLGGSKVNYNLLTTAADSKISIAISGVKIEDKDLPLNVTIAKGLVPEQGNMGTSEEIAANAVLVSPYNLSISNTEAEHDGSRGTVKVYCSQSPVENGLAGFISISPTIKFNTTVTAEGFTITSEDFEVSKTYSLTIKQGLRGKLGGTLQNEYNGGISFGKLQPTVQFTNNKAVYLGSKGAKNIEAQITSVPKVRVIISKIYENNLLHSSRYGYSPDGIYDNAGDEEYYEEDYYGGDYYSGGESKLGDVILDKVYDTKTLPRNGSNRLFKFDFEDKLKDLKGIYHIRIQSTTQYWLSDSRYISLSDIGLIARQSEDKVYVFANSISTAEPLSNVTINLIGLNNQQTGSAKTNSSGVAEIDAKKLAYNGFRGAMITARDGNDFNYMPFSSTHVNTSRFETGGKRSNSTNLDCFIYGERELYRPGEKVNLSVVIRDWKWKNPGDLPLKMKLLLPNGKELKTIKKAVNDEGSAEAQFDLSPAAVTGTYFFQVFTGNDVLLNSKNILVEEFMPDRIKVTTTADKQDLKPGDAVNFSILAQNYFGPPAANRNYQLEIQLANKSFYPEKYYKYNFNLVGKTSYFESIVREGKTDEQGNAKESYTVPTEYINSGIIRATFFTTVFDETGRPVNRNTSLDIVTQDVFYGIGSTGDYWLPLNRNAAFPLIAVDKNGKALNNQLAHVQVVKRDYRTVLSRYGEYFRYESQRDYKTLIDQTVTVSGENTIFNFMPRSSGSYEIRISKPGVNTYAVYSFYSYGGYGSSGNFEVDNEGNIDMELDKKAYQTGEKAKVLFKTPFDGKLLVTIETNKVLEHKYISTDNRAASFEFSVSEEYLPNAYITATLIKPHKESDMPLVVAHGFQSFSVEEKARKMNVEIMAEKQVRSRTHQKVRVKAAAGSKITLAAVDEGILQVTGYKTPDPYAYFYEKRALEVEPYDLYPLLFPELNGTLSSTGGDGFDLSKRTNPMQNKRVKLVSYWSGISEVGSNGEAAFEFDIPQFSGELRLMAVAYKGSSFGNDEARMTVADPIVISTALPRFFSPGDTVVMAVTATNTTKANAQASVQIKTSATIKVLGQTAEAMSLPAGKENRKEFLVVAQPQAGVGKVTVSVKAMNETFMDETDITIRPAASLQKITSAGSIAAGSAKQFNLSDKFIAGSEDYYLVITKNPVLSIADQVYHLVNYPYGCTEQTVSAAFPQLYFGDIAELMRMDAGIKTNANQNVQEAIRKIKMRQLYNGGLTLWDGEGSEHWWATVYAAHFLLEAKKAGFDVEQSLMDNIYSYLIAKLKNRETYTYYYNRNQKKEIAAKEVAYSLYVLALAGKAQVSTMNYYKQNAQLLALDSRYLLSAAYAIAGDKAKFNEMLPTSFAGEAADRETGGGFSSAVRDEAIALNALLEVDAKHPQAAVMAKHVAEELKKDAWYSTQERAFGFLALGKMARLASQSNVSATVKVNGKTIATNDGSLLKLSSKQLGGSKVEVSTSGSGQLYYFWQAEGIPLNGQVKEEDSYLKVRKRFYDRKGNLISGTNFKQNDLIIVGITLESSYNRKIENVVITDLLPAGFEIENPRTTQIPGMDWIKNESSYQYLDVRDDRINIFTEANSYTKYYYYAVRAVSPGTYTMGPVMADAMYNGEYHSYNGAGVVRVSGR